VHFVGIAQSFGLFFVVCLATATLLSLAMAALTRMERATVPVARRERGPVKHEPAALRSAADRVSSPGSCTFGPRGR
jgi:hypothetical protein